MTPLTTLNWFWIALAATIPPALAVVVAIPFWRKRQGTFGSIAGTAVIFASSVGLILREYVELDRLVQECLDAGSFCWPAPSAFARFAIYASIGMSEVFALFILSLKVDERIRGREYAPEWR